MVFNFRSLHSSPRRCANADGLLCQHIQSPTAESHRALPRARQGPTNVLLDRLQKYAAHVKQSTVVRQIIGKPQPLTEHLVKDLG